MINLDAIKVDARQKEEKEVDKCKHMQEKEKEEEAWRNETGLLQEKALTIFMAKVPDVRGGGTPRGTAEKDSCRDNKGQFVRLTVARCLAVVLHTCFDGVVSRR